ncbi:hypothetical protein Tco_0923659 [Tanacetum coccineum]|uniref:Uncharacterized protein n=1 Tax=Tanacetum coccineum TaxID=301880 RepID=A0ABQ5D1M5_9ASTR
MLRKRYDNEESFAQVALLEAVQDFCLHICRTSRMFYFAIDTRKTLSGGIPFIVKLVSWMSKKKNCTAMSSAEAEYVALSARPEYQLADMFTKALPEERFQYLVRRIGMRCLTPAELEVLTKEFA